MIWLKVSLDVKITEFQLQKNIFIHDDKSVHVERTYFIQKNTFLKSNFNNL